MTGRNRHHFCAGGSDEWSRLSVRLKSARRDRPGTKSNALFRGVTMSDTPFQSPAAGEQVSVMLKLDPHVYEFFSEKARKAEVGIETYLASTLSIVLGCGAFNKMSVCSPKPLEKTGEESTR
jgi:hypothetical protein